MGTPTRCESKNAWLSLWAVANIAKRALGVHEKGGQSVEEPRAAQKFLAVHSRVLVDHFGVRARGEIGTYNRPQTIRVEGKLFLHAGVELGVLYEPYLAVTVLRDQKT